MIYVTGDTHGAPVRLSEECMPFAEQWGKEDTLIVCGDFGYLMNRTTREDLFLRELSFRPYTICFVDGNRDNHDLLNAYPVTQWQGGKVHKLRRNVIHLMRGQVYDIGGRRIFTMGGGFSVDKVRRFHGVDWWPEEMPDKEQYDEAWQNLQKAGMKVDTIITHTGPMSVLDGLCPISQQEYPLNTFLDKVKKEVQFRNWYFGHIHLDTALQDQLYAMFLSVRELTSGKQIW